MSRFRPTLKATALACVLLAILVNGVVWAQARLPIDLSGYVTLATSQVISAAKTISATLTATGDVDVSGTTNFIANTSGTEPVRINDAHGLCLGNGTGVNCDGAASASTFTSGVASNDPAFIMSANARLVGNGATNTVWTRFDGNNTRWEMQGAASGLCIGNDSGTECDGAVTLGSLAGSSTTATTTISSPISAASATSAVAGVTIQATTDIDATDLVFAVRDSAGNPLLRVREDALAQFISISTQTFAMSTSDFTFSGNGTANFISSISAATATSSNAAYRFLPANALDATDSLFRVTTEAGTMRFDVTYAGDASTAGTFAPGSYATGSLPTCSGGTGAGKIAYDSTTNKHVGCDGTAWNNMY